MSKERKDEIFRLMQAEYKELEERISILKQETKELVEELRVMEEYMGIASSENDPMTVGQENGSITIPSPGFADKESVGNEYSQELLDIESKGDRVIYLLKNVIERGASLSQIESTYRETLALDELVKLRFSVRNKVKRGEIFVAKANNSLKYAFNVLPEWIGLDGQLIPEYKPESRFLPKNVRGYVIIRHDEDKKKGRSPMKILSG